MVDTNAEANSALARATSQANAALLQLHDQFALAKNTFQEQLMQDLDASTAKSQSFIERLVRGVDAAVQTAMSNLASVTTEVEADTARLSEVCVFAHILYSSPYLIFARMSARPMSIQSTSRGMWVKSFSRLLRAAENLQRFRHSTQTAPGRWRENCRDHCKI